MLVISIIMLLSIIILADRALRIEDCMEWRGLSSQEVNALFERDMRNEIKLNDQDINCLIAL